MKVATNRHLINKASIDELKRHNSTFKNTDQSISELASHINHGFAFCSQYKSNHRSSNNFLSAGFVAVDIDHGLTLEAVKEDPYFQQYASLLYTTPSHTDSLHRFRIVFELEEPITDKARMQYALTGLIGRFGADGACKDACRIFFGSKGSSPIMYGNRLPPSEVEQLVIRGRELSVPRDTHSGDARQRPSAVRSRISIPKGTLVRSSHGERRKLADFPDQTRIYCSQHSDLNPSAITLRSKRSNTAGFYCSACNATFFEEDNHSFNRDTTPYRFDYHWNSVLNASLEEYTAYMDEDGRFSLSELRGGDIKVIDTKFLAYEEPSLLTIEPGKGENKDLSPYFDLPAPLLDGLHPKYNLNLVKSPKGTGKTKWLEASVKELKAAGVSVLLVGHRRALISATANRIGLDCYLDGGPATTYLAPTSHFAICADSLFKLDTKRLKYDVVIIDEVEQVFAHLLSGTLRENRREVLHTLGHYLNSARSLYLLDADLGKPTVDILDLMLDEKTRNFQAIVNTYQTESKTIQLYQGAKSDHLIGELLQSIERGERCFVCSNSKEFVIGLENEVKKRVSRPVNSIVITSDNSNTPEIQAFVREITTRGLEYDVIFTSPALGTGIDITFEGGAQLIDTVYGFFQPRINTHFDIDQQLARVRNPKQVKVWISSEQYSYETDVDAIKAELSFSEAEHRALLYIKPDGTKVYHLDDLYDTVFSTITAYQRASKNHLRKHFIDLKRSNGWTVEEVNIDAPMSEVGKSLRQAAKKEQRQLQADRILRAERITADKYEDLRRKGEDGALNEAETATLRRYELESFYLEEATTGLLATDKFGEFRQQLRDYEIVMASDEELRRFDQNNDAGLKPDRERRLLRKQILCSLLEAAGVMGNGEFQPDYRVEASALSKFVDICIYRRDQMERIFDVALRSDFRKKPVTQLQVVLKLIGLKLEKSGRDQSAGQSKIIYQLCGAALQDVQSWAIRRADDNLREEWNRERKGYEENGSDIPQARHVQRYRDPLETE